MHSEVTALLENAGNVVNLEIAYETSPGQCWLYCIYSTVEPLSLYKDTPELRTLSKQATFPHPKYHSCMY